MRYEVIPYSVHRHISGKTVSIYGAVPWRSDNERKEWETVQLGWTVRNPHTGQVGVGRKPWATQQEAEEFASKHTPSRIGMGD